jgi:hypothetical protein
MSDFLTNLAARSLNLVPKIKPRVPSLYEPMPAHGATSNFAPWQESQAREEGKTEATWVSEPRMEARPHADNSVLADQDSHRITTRPSVAPIPYRGSQITPSTSSPAHSFVHTPDADPETSISQARPISLLQSTYPDKVEKEVTPSSGTNLEVVQPLKDIKSPTGSLASERGALSGERTVQVAEQPESPAVPIPHPSKPTPVVIRPQVKPVQPDEPKTPANMMAAPKFETAPPIRVTIGRVEVRAIMPPATPPPKPTPLPAPRLSLDDYLKKREGE